MLVLCDIIAHSPFSVGEIMKHGRDLLLDRVFGRARMELLTEYRRSQRPSVFKSPGSRTSAAKAGRVSPTGPHNADTYGTEVEALLGREALDEFIAATQVLRSFGTVAGSATGCWRR